MIQHPAAPIRHAAGVTIRVAPLQLTVRRLSPREIIRELVPELMPELIEEAR